MPCGRVRAKCCGCTKAFQAFRAGSIPVARFVLPRGVAQSGSAPGWGPGGRRFKSCLPDRDPGCDSNRRDESSSAKFHSYAGGYGQSYRDWTATARVRAQGRFRRLCHESVPRQARGTDAPTGGVRTRQPLPPWPRGTVYFTAPPSPPVGLVSWRGGGPFRSACAFPNDPWLNQLIGYRTRQAAGGSIRTKGAVSRDSGGAGQGGGASCLLLRFAKHRLDFATHEGWQPLLQFAVFSDPRSHLRAPEIVGDDEFGQRDRAGP
jgi:hypothetical protein